MAKPFYVYILKCRDGSFYTGHTDDICKRLWQHENGTFPDCYTFERRPVSMFYCEALETRENAINREIQIKNWSRAKKIALAQGDWKSLSLFSKSPHERPSASLGVDGLCQKPTTPSEAEGRSNPLDSK
jgi:putative endonuclease